MIKIKAFIFFIAVFAGALSHALVKNGVEAIVVVDSDWDNGYCARVTLTNHAPIDIESWMIDLNIHQSTINNLWNGQQAENLITPMAYNALITPEEAVNFGFCATKTGVNYLPDIVDIILTPEDPTSDFDNDGVVDAIDEDDDNDGIADDIDHSLSLVLDVDLVIPPVADYLLSQEFGTLILSHKNDFELSFIQAANGEIESRMAFEYMPESMALSPDGQTLYVALLTREHSSYWWEADQFGYIAVIDVGSQTLVNTFKVATDPYDLVVSRNGKLIISSGSGQWTDIFAYDAELGTFLGSTLISQRSKLSLHPTHDWVFAADTDLSPSDIEKFDIGGEGIIALGDSPYHGDHRMNGNVWASHNYVFTRGGDVFLSSDLSYVESVTAVGVTIENVNFDVDQGIALLSLSDGTTRVLNVESLQEITTIMGEGDIVYAGLSNNLAYYVSLSGTNLSLLKQSHPCSSCSNNTAPTASISYSPLGGSTAETFIFDASGSTDLDDGANLRYRWDLDSDGAWDSAWSADPIAAKDYLVPGVKFLRLQVVDSQGAIDTYTLMITIEAGTRFAEAVPEGDSSFVNFTVADSLYDEKYGNLYLSDKENQRLLIADPVTGLAETYFEFDHMVERMTISPDGSTLYVALLGQEHSSYWWDEDQFGYIAVFDLELQAHVNTFKTAIDPYDLVATRNGKLVVSSGSGQWTDIVAYDSNTGAVLGASGIRQRSKLSLHPTEDWVFAANTDSSPSDIEKFDVSGEGIISVGDSPYHGDYRMSGNVWADTTYIFTRGGDVFLASDMSYVNSYTAPGVYIENVSFDHAAGVAFLVLSDGQVDTVNLSSLQTIASVNFTDDILNVYASGDSVFYLYSSGSAINVLEDEHPCLAVCRNNLAPVAQFSVSPQSLGSTMDVFVFDGSLSTDPENALLSYRWDLDNDGEWDSDFSQSAIATKKFDLSGIKSISLQVRDEFGESNTVTHIIDVLQGIDTGVEIIDGDNFALDFTITDSEYDDVSGKLYLSDKANQRLVVVDALTGLAQKYFQFETMPESLTLSPDGSTLYVALLVHEHSSYRSEEDQLGYIAVIDTQSQAHVNTFEVAIDPYDLVVTDDEKLVISSGSGQWTYLNLYDAAQGDLLDYAFIRQRSRLSLHPSQGLVFAADTDISPSDIEKFSILDDQIISLGDSPYHGDYRMSGDVWAGTTYTFTRGGDVFLSSDLSYVTSYTEIGVYIENVSFDANAGVAFLVLSNGQVDTLISSTLNTIESIRFDGDVSSVYASGDTIFYVYSSKGLIQVVEEVHPCLSDCRNNLPPVAGFTISYQGAGNTEDEFVFDASISTDPENALLSYRWDLNGDGQWDTDFMDASSIGHQFIVPGLHSVSLQVRDEFGALGTITHVIDVLQSIDFGVEIVGGESYLLDFDIADSEINTINGKLYLADKANKRLVVVDAITGLAQKYFQFSYAPEKMSLSPDGSTLYVALLVNDLDPGGREDDPFAYMAVIETEIQAHTKTFGIELGLNDVVAGLVAISDSTLAILSGSNDKSKMHLYDGIQGLELDSHDIFVGGASSLSLLASQGILYAVTSFGNNNDFVWVYHVDGETLAQSNFEITDHLGDLWVDTNYIFTRDGDVLSSSNLSFVKRYTEEGVSINAISFDSESGLAFLALSNGKINTVSLSSLETLASEDVAGDVSRVYTMGGSIFYIYVEEGILRINQGIQPCLTGCDTNLAPVADFSIQSQGVGSIADEFVFDASASYDPEGQLLLYRWDFDGDGEWDTDFTEDFLVTTQYNTAGEKLVSLQVKDKLGESSSITQTINVINAVDTGIEVVEGDGFSFDVDITDAIFDDLKAKIYLSDKANKRLIIVDAFSGLPEKYFQFNLMPERISLSPNGSTLYVALLAHEHSASRSEADQLGYITVIDVEQQARVNTFKVAVDPYDLVARDDETLMISSGASSPKVHWYDVMTGSQLDSVLLFEQSRLLLNVSHDWVFAVSDFFIQKFSILGDVIVDDGLFPLFVSYPYADNMWSLSDTLLLTSGGTIILAKDMSFVANLETNLLQINAVSFNELENVVTIINADGVIVQYNATTWAELASYTELNDPQFLWEDSDGVKFFERGTDGLVMQVLSP